MFSFDVSVGNTIVTKASRNGIVVSGRVLSKGPKKCTVLDASGKDWGVPYEMIIACTDTKEEVSYPKAKAGDIILNKQGEKYKIDKVNTSRYTATRISDGRGYYVPFHHVVEILDEKKSQRDAQKAFLVSKGFTAKDIAEFEALFGK